MEMLNKIELRGYVGRSSIKSVGDTRVARFSLAVDYMFKDASGCGVIETTWFNCSAWEGRDVRDIDKLAVGVCAHIIGRFRQNRYTNADGQERTVYEVVVSTLDIIEDQQ